MDARITFLVKKWYTLTHPFPRLFVNIPQGKRNIHLHSWHKARIKRYLTQFLEKTSTPKQNIQIELVVNFLWSPTTMIPFKKPLVRPYFFVIVPDPARRHWNMNLAELRQCLWCNPPCFCWLNPKMARWWFQIHPGKLRWNPTMKVWKMINFPFQLGEFLGSMLIFEGVFFIVNPREMIQFDYCIWFFRWVETKTTN